MPSPFPGMDPYLERRDIFPNLHSSLVTFLMEHLQPRLTEPYYAASSRRTWIEVSDRLVEPDVHVVRQLGGRRKRKTEDSAVAVAERERRRAFAVAERHGACLLDAVQCR